MRISSSEVHFAWDNQLAPVADVQDGHRVELDLVDSGGQLTPASDSEALLGIEFDRVNPVTGPLRVVGAEPGDSVAVEIVDLAVGYLLQLLAGVGWSSLPALPLIRQPTLVLAGSDDPIIPLVNARIMTRLLPHATLHVFDDGHLGLVTLADELGPLVSGFLRDR
jgi:pimeloyl-ACP methyl ester carboxylesterase